MNGFSGTRTGAGAKWAALLGVCLWMGSPATAQVETIGRTLKDEAVNELALWDLGNDGVYEIFLSTVSGRVMCYSALELDLMWDRQLESGALTAPVLGDFLGNGAPVLAVAGANGRVTFLWPGTGEPVGQIELSERFSLAPSVADFRDEGRQELVLISEKSEIFVVGFESADSGARLRLVVPNTIADATAFSVLGRIAFPASVADIDGDGRPEVVTVSDTGIIQVVSLVDNPERSFQHLPQNSRATTLAAVVPMTGGAQAQVLLGSGSSLQVFDWTRGNERLRARLSATAYGDSRGQIVVADMGESVPRGIVTLSEKIAAVRYVGQVGNGEVVLDFAAGNLATLTGPLSTPVLARDARGEVCVVAADGNEDVLVWRKDGEPGLPQVAGKAIVPAGAFTPAGALRGDGKLSLVSWSAPDFRLSVHTLPLDVAKDSAPMLTLGVNYARDGGWTQEWAERYSGAQVRAGALLDSLKTSYSAGGDGATSGVVAMMRGIAPEDELARSLTPHSGSWFSWGRVALGLVVAAIVGLVVNSRVRQRGL